MRFAVLAVAVFSFGIGQCGAAETIVGKWAQVGGSCKRMPDLVIEPMAIVAEEMRCDFRDVSRSGDLVTWHGECSDGAETTKTTAKAKLTGRRLAVSLNGNEPIYYERCR